MTENVADKVKAIIADKLGVDPAKVVDEARFVDDLGADSLDTVELVKGVYRIHIQPINELFFGRSPEPLLLPF